MSFRNVMNSRLPFCCSAVWAAAIAFAPSLHAEQDGPYDPAFGNVGRTWIDVSPDPNDISYKLIRLPNGNLFMAGICGNVGTCAAWLTPAGALASGYGNNAGNGTVYLSAFAGWPNDTFGITDAAALPDGRVVVVVNRGAVGGYIAMLKADGSGLDPSVGNGAGYVAPSFDARWVRRAGDGFVVVGTDDGSPVSIVVARYDATLHPDTSFGTSGSRTLTFASDAQAQGMTVQKDGKIVLVGAVFTAPTTLLIARLTAGGTPDPAFGVNSDGIYLNNFGTGAIGNDIVEDRQGRLVYVGQAINGVSSKWLVGRLLGGASVDPAFNGGQARSYTIFDTSQDYNPQACCVGLQPDDRIVVAGTMDRNTYYKYFAFSRFRDDGSFDSTFGNGGQSYGDMSSAADPRSDSPNSMVVMPGGIVLGGSTTDTSPETRFVATKVRIDQLFRGHFE